MVASRYSPYDLTSRVRKERKPMVEKLRRERMNNSISQLKELISETIKQHAPPMSRIDKPDILEYAVVHLKQLQQQQISSDSSNALKVSQLYDAGFKDCAREAVTFLSNNRLADDSTVNDVSNHLHTVYRTRKEPSTGSRATTTSGPCLSTPVRGHNMADNSRLRIHITPEVSPIQRCQILTRPQEVTSFRTPDAGTGLRDLSTNSVMSVLYHVDSSRSDVSMKRRISTSSSSTSSSSPSRSSSSSSTSWSTSSSSSSFSIGSIGYSDTPLCYLPTTRDSSTNEISSISGEMKDLCQSLKFDVEDVSGSEKLQNVTTSTKREKSSEHVWRPW